MRFEPLEKLNILWRDVSLRKRESHTMFVM